MLVYDNHPVTVAIILSYIAVSPEERIMVFFWAGSLNKEKRAHIIHDLMYTHFYCVTLCVWCRVWLVTETTVLLSHASLLSLFLFLSLSLSLSSTNSKREIQGSIHAEVKGLKTFVAGPLSGGESRDPHYTFLYLCCYVHVLKGGAKPDDPKLPYVRRENLSSPPCTPSSCFVCSFIFLA